MTGLTYGGTAGGTYGGSTGGLWSPGALHWAIDGAYVPRLNSETRTWQDLSLSFQVDQATLDNDLDPLQSTAEKLDTISKSDGSFETLDRAATDGVYSLTPPVGRDPPRAQRNYLVASFSQTPLDRQVSQYQVDIDFRAKSNREPDGNATDQTRASDEWSFAFRSATIATKRVTPQIGQGTESAANTVELELVLTPVQAKILEESATRLSATGVREVPDGTNSYDDDSASPTDANTVAVTTPDGQSPIRSGDWITVDWETAWVSDEGYRVSLVLGDPT